MGKDIKRWTVLVLLIPGFLSVAYGAEPGTIETDETDIYGDFSAGWTGATLGYYPTEKNPKELTNNTARISKEDVWLFRYDDEHIWDYNKGVPENIRKKWWPYIYWYWADLVAGELLTAYFQVWTDDEVYYTNFFRWNPSTNQWDYIGMTQGWDPPRLEYEFSPEDNIEHFLAVAWGGDPDPFFRHWYADQASMCDE